METLQYVKLLHDPHSKLKIPLKNIKPVTVGGFICLYLGGPIREGVFKLHIGTIYLVYGHRLRPFQRLMMIPGSVTISQVRGFVLAAQTFNLP